MADEFFETERRSFKPISIPELSTEARDAVNAALQAMSTWRNETAYTSEKNSKQVIKKMAAAAVRVLAVAAVRLLAPPATDQMPILRAVDPAIRHRS